ncbi:MAG TPA: TolC family protein [Burkholderiales bacterium]|nr:TolC family protein [Burkholderiales bacterium]
MLHYVAAHDVAKYDHGNVSGHSIEAWDLDTLTLAAFYFSPELDVARAQAGVSEAAIQTAGQRPNPSLQLPLGYTTNAKDGESPYTFGLGLDIPIETAGKRGYRIAHAQQLSNAARFHVGDVAWQLRSRLRNQLLDLYAATRKEEILGRQVAAQQQIAAMLDKRLSLGAASAPEANQAQIALTQTQIALGDARKQMQDQRARIAGTIGVPVIAIANAYISFDAFKQVYPDIATDTARREAILNRADLLAALSDYEASQAALQLEVAKQVPDIHLGPGYTFDKGAHTFGFSISGITLPIFNRNQGLIAEAVARRKEMAARVNAVQAQAIDDTDRAVQNYRAALEQLRRSESVLAQQQRQWRSAEKTFKTGETDRLTLELAQSALDTNMLARQDALAQLQRDIGQLEDALQQPLSATGLQALPDSMENTH